MCSTHACVCFFLCECFNVRLYVSPVHLFVCNFKETFHMHEITQKNVNTCSNTFWIKIQYDYFYVGHFGLQYFCLASNVKPESIYVSVEQSICIMTFVYFLKLFAVFCVMFSNNKSSYQKTNDR